MSIAKATPDYSAFDAELLATIHSGLGNFTGLVARLSSKAEPFCVENKGEAFRVIDRRLQALRKQNKIIYSAKTGWSAVSQR